MFVKILHGRRAGEIADVSNEIAPAMLAAGRFERIGEPARVIARQAPVKPVKPFSNVDCVSMPVSEEWEPPAKPKGRRR